MSCKPSVSELNPVQFELAVGQFPYPFPKDVDIFKQLELVVKGRPPRVPDSAPVSPELRNFIHRWCVCDNHDNIIVTLSLSIYLLHVYCQTLQFCQNRHI